MKQEERNDRPDYGLMKQSDVVQFYHLQFPRWLLEDRRYMPLGIEAKFVYMLLFNRFQLSKHNGWIIWEKRCGRGFANQIYLASVEISETDAMESFGGPLDPLPEETRTAELAGLDGEETVDNAVDNSEVPVGKKDFPVQKQEESVDNMEKSVDKEENHGENLPRNPSEPPKRRF